jgi:hypothetical protein
LIAGHRRVPEHYPASCASFQFRPDGGTYFELSVVNESLNLQEFF